MLQRNVFLLNAENVLLEMLMDEKDEICNDAAMQVLAIRKKKSTKDSSDESEERLTTSSFNSSIRSFLMPLVNFEATCYHEVTHSLSASFEECPLIHNLSNNDNKNIQHSSLDCMATFERLAQTIRASYLYKLLQIFQTTR